MQVGFEDQQEGNAMQRELETCCCGVSLSIVYGITHKYMLSTPSCWDAYGHLLAREYEDPTRWRNHRYSVDAYAAQHPGDDNAQARNSIGVHLSRLYLLFARGWSIEKVDSVMPELVAKKRHYPWLTPPSMPASLTVGDILQTESAEEHNSMVVRWAEAVWIQWAEHREQVQSWWIYLA